MIRVAVRINGTYSYEIDSFKQREQVWQQYQHYFRVQQKETGPAAAPHGIFKKIPCILFKLRNLLVDFGAENTESDYVPWMIMG